MAFAMSPLVTEMIGGSADLTGSNNTKTAATAAVTPDDFSGRYIHFGVREHVMASACNGLALSGLRPYCGTFFVFTDYLRPSLRLSSIMHQPVLYILTHDSIGVGEDGPTHQPVEHVASLRLMPNMTVWRPCDAVESAVSWKAAVEHTTGPSCLIFSRQNLAHQNRSAEQITNIERGGYILKDCDGTPDVIIIATGSEVALAMGAAEQAAGKQVRVVSMPSTTVFDSQDDAYKESVLPSSVTARVAVEAAVTEGWYKYVGLNGIVVGIDRFGESAPAGELFEYFGFTVDNVVKAVNSVS